MDLANGLSGFLADVLPPLMHDPVMFAVPFFLLLLIIIIAGVLVAVVGLLASLDVLRRKPLATLRAE